MQPPTSAETSARETPPSDQPELTKAVPCPNRPGAFVVADRFRTNRYHFDPAERVGCTKLIRVAACSSTGIRRACLGKIVPAAKLEVFLRTEGAAQRVLNVRPHPNLPKVRCCIDPQSPNEPSCLVFPKLSGGDLHTFVRSKRTSQGGLSETTTQQLFRQIASAVSHCHSNGIVLRDIKLGKILFTDSTRSRVVLADLDGAEVMSRQSPLLNDQKGSPAYVSPEVLVCRPYDGAAADMWALGVVLYMMLTGTYPFQDDKPAQLFDKIQRAWRAVTFPPTMPAAARNLIKRLLSKQPDRRLTAEELLAHPWVSAQGTPSRPAPVVDAGASCEGDRTVPDVGSPTLGRRRMSPADLQPLLIAPAISSPMTSPVASPMSTGNMMQKMWQPADLTVTSPRSVSASSAKRRPSFTADEIEQAFAQKAAQLPKLHRWATASSQPPSPPPILPADGVAPALAMP